MKSQSGDTKETMANVSRPLQLTNNADSFSGKTKTTKKKKPTTKPKKPTPKKKKKQLLPWM